MSRKEKGYIGMSFGIALEAVTLYRFGPFRTIIYWNTGRKPYALACGMNAVNFLNPFCFHYT